ncbi:SUMF1/EgtB/PvdO family nonheme iron enzyme [Candidatus Symbiothrix dinenymphae]|uniref:SUMF1/EgtB/PvdO family nonheme iron enzyme n=1 Tax=Candidatus Symbiothrix dinenymphae TaxID=467085 RepID=UPI0006E2DE45|nr:SUMF1/EgtB/PvdO family nonheme iron enzyme [Candidatus Symbiothrix dinenymphae]
MRSFFTGKGSFFHRKSFYLILGLLVGMSIVISAYQTSVYFSTDDSCAMCHVHPHATTSWKQSHHFNNKSGTRVHCVDCHLPPKTNTYDHYTAKLKLGARDLWSFLTKDSADIDWDFLSEIEQAVTYIPNESCKDCHHNLFPEGINDDGITAHLYYDENEKKLDLQCISCHLDAGHYNPNYKHGKLAIGDINVPKVDPSLYFKTATPITAFENFREQIPGSPISFDMIAIPGGTFKMGSPEKESFHKPDEGPVHNVTLSPFFMSEVEVTWDMYNEFFFKTQSEGRTPPEAVYANNSRADVDAISGPTPPFGFPNQGWGSGNRPAITMTHYAAETFCQWLSKVTGKKYRLPTEAEWEYAARGGTETPYFFEGKPKSYSNEGFWRNFSDADVQVISDYAIYVNNSKNRTQEPDAVKANPFGLKNMLGNVLEYCADKYDPQAYTKTGDNATNPLVTEGEDWVVRGGNYASDAADLRCAARDFSKHDAWLKTDPQQPKSIWWYSDIRGIGFRIVCVP